MSWDIKRSWSVSRALKTTYQNTWKDTSQDMPQDTSQDTPQDTLSFLSLLVHISACTSENYFMCFFHKYIYILLFSMIHFVVCFLCVWVFCIQTILCNHCKALKSFIRLSALLVFIIIVVAVVKKLFQNTNLNLFGVVIYLVDV